MKASIYYGNRTLSDLAESLDNQQHQSPTNTLNKKLLKGVTFTELENFLIQGLTTQFSLKKSGWYGLRNHIRYCEKCGWEFSYNIDEIIKTKDPNKIFKLVAINKISSQNPISKNPELQRTSASGGMAMNQDYAKLIILNAVESTSSRWIQYAESWKNIDTIFILRGYEQLGFHFFKMKPLLEDFHILSIDSLGKILPRYPYPRNYDRVFAGSLSSEFYTSARKGVLGKEGQLFEKAVRQFLERRIGNTGQKFWALLYHLLQACTFLTQYHSSSFATYVVSKYENFSNKHHVSEHEFLNMSVSEWEHFLKRAKPWTELKGIGPNVFDFLFGDIVEAHFVENSYKWDSSNEHFFRTTGISRLIEPFDREATVHFLRRLGIPYSLREINKGIYTYCSLTERKNYGFCRDRSKCNWCSVINICDKKL